jgi:Putative Ig domain/Ricin-type beta-trefoil lectin domain
MLGERMKRLLVLVLWVAAGTSILALTSSAPVTAGIHQGTGTHRAQAHVPHSRPVGPVHVINLHKDYEARLGKAILGNIAGKVPTFGTLPLRGRGGNNCAEPICAVQYNGGPVQHNPHVYLLLWGPNWETDPSQEATATFLENFYSGLGDQPQDNWSTVMSEYPDGSGPPTFSKGVYAGTWNDISSPPTNGMLGQEGLATEADTFTEDMGVADLNDAQVVIATQSGTCPDGFAAPMCTGGSGGGYCAWHSSSNEPYTNLPYILDAGAVCGADSVNSDGTDDGLSIVAGHEYASTITDPFPYSGWWDPADPNGGEITDKCVWNGRSRDVTLATGIFAMQPEWSNNSGGCVMHIGGNSDIVTMTNPPNQTTYQNSVVSLTVEATSSDHNPVTWSATGLPPGLTIDPATGIITGKLTASTSDSPYSVIASASDTTGAFAWAPFTWTVLADVGTPITNQASGTCLNDHYGANTTGTPVLWKCLNGPAEMFSQPTNSGELIVLGQCMSDPTGTHKSGAGALQVLAPCTGATNQMWFHNAQNEYVLEFNFMCLTNQGGVTENGAPVSIEPCTGATDQIWSGN